MRNRQGSSGGVRAVGILTQGTRSSGAVFRRVSSGGVSSDGLFCACCPDRLCHFFKMKT